MSLRLRLSVYDPDAATKPMRGELREAVDTRQSDSAHIEAGSWQVYVMPCLYLRDDVWLNATSAGCRGQLS